MSNLLIFPIAFFKTFCKNKPETFLLQDFISSYFVLYLDIDNVSKGEGDNPRPSKTINMSVGVLQVAKTCLSLI